MEMIKEVYRQCRFHDLLGTEKSEVRYINQIGDEITTILVGKYNNTFMGFDGKEYTHIHRDTKVKWIGKQKEETEIIQCNKTKKLYACLIHLQIQDDEFMSDNKKHDLNIISYVEKTTDLESTKHFVKWLDEDRHPPEEVKA